MRAIGILGSPRRNGNTGMLMDTALAGFTAMGHEAEVYHLKEMQISDCDGCLECKKEPSRITGCVIDDDMQILYEAIRGSDAVIVGSPIYMHDLTGRTRIFINRLFAFHRPGHVYGLTPPKPAFLFDVHGQRDFEHYDRSLYLPVGAMTMAGLRFVNIFSVGGLPMGEPCIKAGFHNEVLLTARVVGRWLAEALERGMLEKDFKRFGSMDGLDISAASGVIPNLKLELNHDRIREVFGDEFADSLQPGDPRGGSSNTE